MARESRITKAIASLVLAVFLYTFVLHQPLYGITTLVREGNQAREITDKLESFVLPYRYGRIMGGEYRSPSRLLVYIQDLHCHPEVQRNIYEIIRFFDRKYGVKKILVEGAPCGKVDTGILAAIPNETVKQKALETLLGKGLLSGAEYYSVIHKEDKLYGLEQWDVYEKNLVRIRKLLEDKRKNGEIVQELKDRLSEARGRYLSHEIRRLLVRLHPADEKSKSSAKRYLLLEKLGWRVNEDTAVYPNLSLYIEMLRLNRDIRFKRLPGELSSYVAELKSVLPYRVYQTLMQKLEQGGGEEEYYLALSGIAQEYTPRLAARFPDVARFLEYIRLNYRINPVCLVSEEQSFCERVLQKHAKRLVDRELLLLSRMAGIFKDLVELKVTPEEFAYFVAHRDEFRALLRKYVPIDELTESLSLLDDRELLAFYDTNLFRNDIFIRNVLALTPSVSTGEGLGEGVRAHAGGDVIPAKAGIQAVKGNYRAVFSHLEDFDDIEIVVTGGFHSQITRSMGDVSYLAITPNVTKDFNESIYEKVLTGRITSRDIRGSAFAPILVSVGLARDEAAAREQLEVVLGAITATEKTTMYDATEALVRAINEQLNEEDRLVFRENRRNNTFSVAGKEKITVFSVDEWGILSVESMDLQEHGAAHDAAGTRQALTSGNSYDLVGRVFGLEKGWQRDRKHGTLEIIARIAATVLEIPAFLKIIQQMLRTGSFSWNSIERLGAFQSFMNSHEYQTRTQIRAAKTIVFATITGALVGLLIGLSPFLPVQVSFSASHAAETVLYGLVMGLGGNVLTHLAYNLSVSSIEETGAVSRNIALTNGTVYHAAREAIERDPGFPGRLFALEALLLPNWRLGTPDERLIGKRDYALTTRLIRSVVLNDPEVLHAAHKLLSPEELADTRVRLHEPAARNPAEEEIAGLIREAGMEYRYGESLRQVLNALNTRHPDHAWAPPPETVYADLDELEKDITHLEEEFRRTGVDRLPRVGIHGEPAGHTPTGQFYYYVVDTESRDYRRSEFKHTSSIGLEMHERQLSFTDVFMPIDEFLERLQGTVIKCSQYGGLSVASAGYPELYVVKEMPGKFELREDSSKEYDTTNWIGGTSYRLFYLEGSRDAGHVPDEALVEKIGVSEGEVKAALGWAIQENLSKKQSQYADISNMVRDYLLRLLYKKTLAVFLDLERNSEGHQGTWHGFLQRMSQHGTLNVLQRIHGKLRAKGWDGLSFPEKLLCVISHPVGIGPLAGETGLFLGASALAKRILGIAVMDPTGVSSGVVAAVAAIGIAFSLVHPDLYERGIGWKERGVRFVNRLAVGILLVLPFMGLTFGPAAVMSGVLHAAWNGSTVLLGGKGLMLRPLNVFTRGAHTGTSDDRPVYVAEALGWELNEANSQYGLYPESYRERYAPLVPVLQGFLQQEIENIARIVAPLSARFAVKDGMVFFGEGAEKIVVKFTAETDFGRQAFGVRLMKGSGARLEKTGFINEYERFKRFRELNGVAIDIKKLYGEKGRDEFDGNFEAIDRELMQALLSNDIFAISIGEFVEGRDVADILQDEAVSIEERRSVLKAAVRTITRGWLLTLEEHEDGEWRGVAINDLHGYNLLRNTARRDLGDVIYIDLGQAIEVTGEELIEKIMRFLNDEANLAGDDPEMHDMLSEVLVDVNNFFARKRSVSAEDMPLMAQIRGVRDIIENKTRSTSADRRGQRGARNDKGKVRNALAIALLAAFMWLSPPIFTTGRDVAHARSVDTIVTPTEYRENSFLVEQYVEAYLDAIERGEISFADPADKEKWEEVKLQFGVPDDLFRYFKEMSAYIYLMYMTNQSHMYDRGGTLAGYDEELQNILLEHARELLTRRIDALPGPETTNDELNLFEMGRKIYNGGIQLSIVHDKTAVSIDDQHSLGIEMPSSQSFAVSNRMTLRVATRNPRQTTLTVVFRNRENQVLHELAVPVPPTGREGNVTDVKPLSSAYLRDPATGLPLKGYEIGTISFESKTTGVSTELLGVWLNKEPRDPGSVTHNTGGTLYGMWKIMQRFDHTISFRDYARKHAWWAENTAFSLLGAAVTGIASYFNVFGWDIAAVISVFAVATWTLFAAWHVPQTLRGRAPPANLAAATGIAAVNLFVGLKTASIVAFLAALGLPVLLAPAVPVLTLVILPYLVHYAVNSAFARGPAASLLENEYGMEPLPKAPSLRVSARELTRFSSYDNKIIVARLAEFEIAAWEHREDDAASALEEVREVAKTYENLEIGSAQLSDEHIERWKKAEAFVAYREKNPEARFEDFGEDMVKSKERYAREFSGLKILGGEGLEAAERNSGLSDRQLESIKRNSKGSLHVYDFLDSQPGPAMHGGVALGARDRAIVQVLSRVSGLTNWSLKYDANYGHRLVTTKEFMSDITKEAEKDGRTIVYFVPRNAFDARYKDSVTRRELEWLLQDTARMKNVLFVFGAYDTINFDEMIQARLLAGDIFERNYEEYVSLLYLLFKNHRKHLKDDSSPGGNVTGPREQDQRPTPGRSTIEAPAGAAAKEGAANAGAATPPAGAGLSGPRSAAGPLNMLRPLYNKLARISPAGQRDQGKRESVRQQHRLRQIGDQYGIIDPASAVAGTVRELALQALRELGQPADEYAIVIADSDEINASFYPGTGERVIEITWGLLQFLRRNGLLNKDTLKFILGHEGGHAITREKETNDRSYRHTNLSGEYQADEYGLLSLEQGDGAKAYAPGAALKLLQALRDEKRRFLVTITHPQTHRRQAKVYNEIRSRYWRNLHGATEDIPETQLALRRSPRFYFDEQLYGTLSLANVRRMLAQAATYNDIFKAVNLFNILLEFAAILEELRGRQPYLSVPPADESHIRKMLEGKCHVDEVAFRFLSDSAVDVSLYFSDRERENIRAFARNVTGQGSFDDRELRELLLKLLAYRIYLNKASTGMRDPRFEPYSVYRPIEQDEDDPGYRPMRLWEHRRQVYRSFEGLSEEVARQVVRTVPGIERLSDHDREQLVRYGLLGGLRYLDMRKITPDMNRMAFQPLQWDEPDAVVKILMRCFMDYHNDFLKTHPEETWAEPLYREDRSLFSTAGNGSFAAGYLKGFILEITKQDGFAALPLERLLDVYRFYLEYKHVMPVVVGNLNALEFDGKIRDLMLRKISGLREFSETVEALGGLVDAEFTGIFKNVKAWIQQESDSAVLLQVMDTLLSNPKLRGQALSTMTDCMQRLVEGCGMVPEEAIGVLDGIVNRHGARELWSDKDNAWRLAQAYAYLIGRLDDSGTRKRLIKKYYGAYQHRLTFSGRGGKGVELSPEGPLLTLLKRILESEGMNPLDRCVYFLEQGYLPDSTVLSAADTPAARERIFALLLENRERFENNRLMDGHIDDLVSLLAWDWFFSPRDTAETPGSLGAFIARLRPSFRNTVKFREHNDSLRRLAGSREGLAVLFDLAGVMRMSSLAMPGLELDYSLFRDFKTKNQGAYLSERGGYPRAWDRGKEDHGRDFALEWGRYLFDRWLAAHPSAARREKIAHALLAFPEKSAYRNSVLIGLVGDPLTAPAAAFEQLFAYLDESTIKDFLAKRIILAGRDAGTLALSTHREVMDLMRSYFAGDTELSRELQNELLQDIDVTPDELKELVDTQGTALEQIAGSRKKAAAHFVLEHIADSLENDVPRDKREIFEWLIGLRSARPDIIQFYEFKYKVNLSDTARMLRLGSESQRYLFLTTLFIGPNGILNDDVQREELLARIFKHGTGEQASDANVLFMIFRELFNACPEMKRMDLMLGMFNHFTDGSKPGEGGKYLLIRTVLSSFGVVGVKLGQILSKQKIVADASLKTVLESLSDKAPALDKRYLLNALLLTFPFGLIRRMVKFFGRLVGSASIKQGYMMELPDGERRVVKYIRPTARYEVEENLEIFRVVLSRLKGRIAGLEQISDTLLDEVDDAARRELDISQEIANQRQIGAFSSGDEFGGWVFEVPVVDPQWTGSQFFADFFAEGEPLKADLVESLSKEGSFSAIAQLIYRAILRQVFINGRYHADLHAGNILVDREHQGVRLLDYGNCGTLSPGHQELLIGLFTALDAGDRGATTRILLRMTGNAGLAPVQGKLGAIVSDGTLTVDKKLRGVKALCDEQGIAFPGEFEVLFKVFDTITYLTDAIPDADQRALFAGVMAQRQTSSFRMLFSRATLGLLVSQLSRIASRVRGTGAGPAGGTLYDMWNIMQRFNPRLTFAEYARRHAWWAENTFFFLLGAVAAGVYGALAYLNVFGWDASVATEVFVTAAWTLFAGWHVPQTLRGRAPPSNLVVATGIAGINLFIGTKTAAITAFLAALGLPAVLAPVVPLFTLIILPYLVHYGVNAVNARSDSTAPLDETNQVPARNSMSRRRFILAALAGLGVAIGFGLVLTPGADASSSDVPQGALPENLSSREVGQRSLTKAEQDVVRVLYEISGPVAVEFVTRAEIGKPFDVIDEHRAVPGVVIPKRMVMVDAMIRIADDLTPQETRVLIEYVGGKYGVSVEGADDLLSLAVRLAGRTLKGITSKRTGGKRTLVEQIGRDIASGKTIGDAALVQLVQREVGRYVNPDLYSGSAKVSPKLAKTAREQAVAEPRALAQFNEISPVTIGQTGHMVCLMKSYLCGIILQERGFSVKWLDVKQAIGGQQYAHVAVLAESSAGQFIVDASYSEGSGKVPEGRRVGQGMNDLSDTGLHPEVVCREFLPGFAASWCSGLADTLFHFGKSENSEDQIAMAEVLYRNSLRLDPMKANAWVMLGVILQETGRASEAREAYLQAISIDPHAWYAWESLAKTLDDLGDTASAAKAREVAGKLKQKSIGAEELRRALEHFKPAATPAGGARSLRGTRAGPAGGTLYDMWNIMQRFNPRLTFAEYARRHAWWAENTFFFLLGAVAAGVYGALAYLNVFGWDASVATEVFVTAAWTLFAGWHVPQTLRGRAPPANLAAATGIAAVNLFVGLKTASLAAFLAALGLPVALAPAVPVFTLILLPYAVHYAVNAALSRIDRLAASPETQGIPAQSGINRRGFLRVLAGLGAAIAPGLVSIPGVDAAKKKGIQDAITDRLYVQLLYTLRGEREQLGDLPEARLEASREISQRKEFRSLVDKTYELLIAKGVLKPSDERYPVLFLTELDREGFAMACFDLGVIIVGNEEFAGALGRNDERSAVRSLAYKIAHERRHIQLKDSDKTLLEQEVETFRDTYLVAEALDEPREALRAQRLVYEAFAALTREFIVRQFGLPDDEVSYIYYADIKYDGGTGRVWIVLRDMRVDGPDKDIVLEVSPGQQPVRLEGLGLVERHSALQIPVISDTRALIIDPERDVSRLTKISRAGRAYGAFAGIAGIAPAAFLLVLAGGLFAGAAAMPVSGINEAAAAAGQAGMQGGAGIAAQLSQLASHILMAVPLVVLAMTAIRGRAPAVDDPVNKHPKTQPVEFTGELDEPIEQIGHLGYPVYKLENVPAPSAPLAYPEIERLVDQLRARVAAGTLPALEATALTSGHLENAFRATVAEAEETVCSEAGLSEEERRELDYAVLIGGSVARKESPSDIDCIVFYRHGDQESIVREIADRIPRIAQRGGCQYRIGLTGCWHIEDVRHISRYSTNIRTILIDAVPVRDARDLAQGIRKSILDDEVVSRLLWDAYRGLEAGSYDFSDAAVKRMLRKIQTFLWAARVWCYRNGAATSAEVAGSLRIADAVRLLRETPADRGGENILGADESARLYALYNDLVALRFTRRYEEIGRIRDSFEAIVAMLDGKAGLLGARGIAEQALRAYDLGEGVEIVERVKPNVFIISSDQGKFVLKFPSYRNKVELMDWEGSLLDAYDRNGIAVATVVRNRTGAYATVVEGRVGVVYRYLEGPGLERQMVEDGQLLAAARAQARIHDAGKTAVLEGRPYRPEEYLPVMPALQPEAKLRHLEELYAALAARGPPDNELDRFFLDNYGTLRSHMRKIRERVPSFEKLPSTVIHGDYNPQNMQFPAGRQAAVIDFEYARVDARVRDFANLFTSAGEDPSLDKLKRYLLAYQAATRSPLTSEELSALPEMFRLWYLEGFLFFMDHRLDNSLKVVGNLLAYLEALDTPDWEGLRREILDAGSGADRAQREPAGIGASLQGVRAIASPKSLVCKAAVGWVVGILGLDKVTRVIDGKVTAVVSDTADAAQAEEMIATDLALGLRLRPVVVIADRGEGEFSELLPGRVIPVTVKSDGREFDLGMRVRYRAVEREQGRGLLVAVEPDGELPEAARSDFLVRAILALAREKNQGGVVESAFMDAGFGGEVWDISTQGAGGLSPALIRALRDTPGAHQWSTVYGIWEQRTSDHRYLWNKILEHDKNTRVAARRAADKLSGRAPVNRVGGAAKAESLLSIGTLSDLVRFARLIGRESAVTMKRIVVGLAVPVDGELSGQGFDPNVIDWDMAVEEFGESGKQVPDELARALESLRRINERQERTVERETLREKEGIVREIAGLLVREGHPAAVAKKLDPSEARWAERLARTRAGGHVRANDADVLVQSLGILQLRRAVEQIRNEGLGLTVYLGTVTGDVAAQRALIETAVFFTGIGEGVEIDLSGLEAQDLKNDRGAGQMSGSAAFLDMLSLSLRDGLRDGAARREGSGWQDQEGPVVRIGGASEALEAVIGNRGFTMVRSGGDGQFQGLSAREKRNRIRSLGARGASVQLDMMREDARSLAEAGIDSGVEEITFAFGAVTEDGGIAKVLMVDPETGSGFLALLSAIAERMQLSRPMTAGGRYRLGKEAGETTAGQLTAAELRRLHAGLDVAIDGKTARLPAIQAVRDLLSGALEDKDTGARQRALQAAVALAGRMGGSRLTSAFAGIEQERAGADAEEAGVFIAHMVGLIDGILETGWFPEGVARGRELAPGQERLLRKMFAALSRNLVYDGGTLRLGTGIDVREALEILPEILLLLEAAERTPFIREVSVRIGTLEQSRRPIARLMLAEAVHRSKDAELWNAVKDDLRERSGLSRDPGSLTAEELIYRLNFLLLARARKDRKFERELNARELLQPCFDQLAERMDAARATDPRQAAALTLLILSLSMGRTLDAAALKTLAGPLSVQRGLIETAQALPAQKARAAAAILLQEQATALEAETAFAQQMHWLADAVAWEESRAEDLIRKRVDPRSAAAAIAFLMELPPVLKEQDLRTLSEQGANAAALELIRQVLTAG